MSLALRIRRGMKLRQPLEIDIEFVEKESAVGGIGAEVVRPRVLQRMERVQPDDTRAQPPAGPFDEFAEVSEIPGPPIRERSQGVQLQGKAPDLHAAIECFRNIAMRRRHDYAQAPLTSTLAPRVITFNS